MLRRLLHTDAAATLGILDETLAGWDALDADLRAAAGLPTPEDGGGRSATQVCWAMVEGRSVIALIVKYRKVGTVAQIRGSPCQHGREHWKDLIWWLGWLGSQRKGWGYWKRLFHGRESCQAQDTGRLSWCSCCVAAWL